MNFFNKILRHALLACLLLFCSTAARAEAGSITLHTKAVADILTILIQNNGRSEATIVSIDGSLGGNHFEKDIHELLPPNQTYTTTVKLKQPPQKGTFPLLSTVHYQLDGLVQSIVGAGTYHHQLNPTEEVTACFLPKRTLRDAVLVPVQHSTEVNRVFLHTPKEFAWQKVDASRNKTLFLLKNLRPNRITTNTIFAVVSGITPEGLITTHICKTIIETRRGALKKPLFSPFAYFVLAWAFLCVALLFVNTTLAAPGVRNYSYHTSRWAFSLAIFCMAVALFYTLGTQIDQILNSDFYLAIEKRLHSKHILENGNLMLDYLSFEAPVFVNFSKWLLPPLLFYFIFCNYFVLKYLKQQAPIDDKYWQLLLCIRRMLPRTNNTSGIYCASSASTGARAILVKYFFSPLLAGWLIQNIEHIVNLGHTFQCNFQYLLAFTTAAIILIDVLIFTCGYLTELRLLKNEIISVDATFLGWFVCLACYPPLNQMLFAIFDTGDPPHIFSEQSLIAQMSAVMVVALWLCYVWASIALGFKASNLTNRGIVESGPYAYVRHPAYAAKVLLWILSCFLLGEKSIPLVTLLAVVYGLRAWTEERHLNQDPAYQRYKEHVPYALIPKLF